MGYPTFTDLGLVDDDGLGFEIKIIPLHPKGFADTRSGYKHEQRERAQLRAGVLAERLHPFKRKRLLHLLFALKSLDLDMRAKLRVGSVIDDSLTGNDGLAVS